MDIFETQRFLKTYAPCGCWGDEAKIPHEENTTLKCRVHLNPLQFARKNIGGGVPEVNCQGGGTNCRPVVKLYRIQLLRRAQLPTSLQINDRIDDAYRAKYAVSAYLSPTIGKRARSATIKITPR